MFINIVTVGTFAVLCLLVFLFGEKIGTVRRSRRFGTETLIGDTASSERRRPVLGSFTTALAAVVPQSANEIQRIERDLKRAGYYRSTALVEYLATRNALIVGILILTGCLAVMADPQTALPETFLGLGLLTTCFGYGLPRLLVHWQGNRRARRIQRGLPDALDIIRMCLTGGLPLRDALKRVSQEIGFYHPDLSVEFAIIHRQADADTMTAALRQFANRIDAPDVNALSAIVTQTDRLGTHVAAAVADYADGVRRASRQRAEERANKTSIKLLFPVILCLAPPIYVLLCGPPVLKLRNFLVDGHKPGGVLDTSVMSRDRLMPQPTEASVEAERNP
jgi:tight adherence protein C